MKKLIIGVLMLLSSCYTNTVDKYVKELINLDSNQKDILFYSIHKGIKNDMGLTLAAIVGKESTYGKNLVNAGDGGSGSYGPYQILLKYSKKRNNAKTKKEIEALKHRLKHDIHFSSEEAIKVYKEWEAYHIRKNNRGKELIKKTVASYNGGGIRSEATIKYAEDIAIREKAIEIYLKKYAIKNLVDIYRILVARMKTNKDITELAKQ